MPVHKTFDLGGPNFKTGRIDHAFHPVNDEEVALFVVVAHVAGAEETFAVDFDEGFLGFQGAVPVTLEDLRPAGDDLAHFADAHLLAGVHVDHP